jgi:hypothetical protein
MFCEIFALKVRINSEVIRPKQILGNNILAVITLVDGDIIKTAHTLTLTLEANLYNSTQIVYSVKRDSNIEQIPVLSFRGHYNWKLCLSVLDYVCDCIIIYKDSTVYDEISLHLGY